MRSDEGIRIPGASALPSCAPITRPAALVVASFVLLLPRPAAASWPSDPTTNVPLCLATGYQAYPAIASDGAGGAIVAWDDQRGGGPRDIYVQRVDANGVPRWTSDGVALCSVANEQYEPEIVSDGKGGAIVVWTDHRNGTTYNIYAQRVDSTGTPKWAANGVAICSATGFQSHPKIVADGSGGAIITWDDSRVSTSHIYAQKVNASGAAQWAANGVLLSNWPAAQERPEIISNGSGGAIVAWFDYRNGIKDIFAQRILSTGSLDSAWPPGGRAVTGGIWDAEIGGLIPDGSGGALVAWDQRMNIGYSKIYVHHLLAAGSLDPSYPAGGRIFSTDYTYQFRPMLVSDGAGGALVAYEDLRWGELDFYAKRVLASGAFDPQWPDTGLALAFTPINNYHFAHMVPSDTSGALVVWMDYRNDDGDVYAQRFLKTGVVDPAWPANGRAICSAERLQFQPVVVPSVGGGAVVAWTDRRTNLGPYGEDGEIYSQGIRGNGQLGDPPVSVPGESGAGLALQSPFPNPMRRGSLRLHFTLPGAGSAALEWFSVGGRRIAGREVGSLGAGRHVVELGETSSEVPGIYFVRLTQGALVRVQRIVLLD
jgi:hypothetical protein